MAADVRLMSSGSIGLTEVAVGVPFPSAALEICLLRDGHLRVRRHARSADHRRPDRTAARMDRTRRCRPRTPPSEAIRRPPGAGEHSPFAYALTKDQLHRPAHAAIDATTEIDPRVREGWLSDETFARIATYMAGLK